MGLMWNSPIRRNWLPLQDKRTLFKQELNPTLNTRLTSEKLSFYLCLTPTLVTNISLFLLYLNSLSKNNGYFWNFVLYVATYETSSQIIWNALLHKVYHRLMFYFSYNGIAFSFILTSHYARQHTLKRSVIHHCYSAMNSANNRRKPIN